jgi:hypothetical protein
MSKSSGVRSQERDKKRLFLGISYPRFPGQEVAGITEEPGDGVNGWGAEHRMGSGHNPGSMRDCRFRNAFRHQWKRPRH